MKFKSSLLVQASGSLGGTTFSHNAGGAYTRNRSTPVNPSSPQQQAVRNALTTISQYWVNTLTQAQRDDWKTYADQVPITNSIGASLPIPALAMFIRCNTPRLQSGLSIVAAAPVIFTIGGFTAPVITVTASTDLASVAFTNTDGWAIAVGGALLVYASKPQNTSIGFFKGPYRYAGKVSGAASPPTSPASMALPFPCAAGQAVFFQVTACLPDGRLAAPLRFRVIAS